jgi:uncharacterized membrane protein
MINIPRHTIASRTAWTTLLVSAATAHIVMPAWFVAYYPSYLPYPHQAVALSAIVELALAALLWVQRTRTIAWSCIALLMVAYIPVHVYVITHHDAITHPAITIPLWLAWLRLPMQGVLVWLAWRER